MLMQQIENNLHALRMQHMAKALREQLNNPAVQPLDFFERMGLLVDAEIHARENTKQSRLFRQARLKINACLEDVDYGVSRGLDRHVMTHLGTCQYIDNALNVIVTGPTGVGKTYISCALGNAAIRKGYSVYSIRLSRLFEEFEISRGDGTLRKYRSKLTKFDLLIIDDWALAPVNALVRHDLLELVDERTGKGSVIFTSQLPVEQWHDYLGEPTVADAILDRVVQRAHRIELRGDSMRKTDVLISDKKS